jgi:purine-binding chemotaxis protein CheW
VAEEMQMVVFTLKSGDTVSEYGVPITQVQEINRLTTPTKLPQVPDFVEGIINLRGKIIPVIDLKKRFGMAISNYTDDSRIMLIEVGGQTIGIIVDEVAEVLRISQANIEPPPPIIGGIAADYLTGVGKLDNRLLIMLDMTKILTEGEKEELGEMVTQ